MKLWMIAALLLTLGVIFVVVQQGASQRQFFAQPTGTSNAMLVSGIGNLASGIGNLFGSIKLGGPSSDSGNRSPFDGGAYSDPTSQKALADFDTSNYTVSNGFMYTDADGTFIAG